MRKVDVKGGSTLYIEGEPPVWIWGEEEIDCEDLNDIEYLAAEEAAKFLVKNYKNILVNYIEFDFFYMDSTKAFAFVEHEEKTYRVVFARYNPYNGETVVIFEFTEDSVEIEEV